jgi:acetoin utilization protein AcuB
MLENVKVQDCMTHPAITVVSKMSVRVAQQIMHDYHIRHLPVVEGQRVVGMLSSGDIRRARPSDATTLSVWEMHALWGKVTVETVMSRRLITVQPETEMREAVRLMYEHRFNSLPVVDAVGKLVGILTEVDVYRLLLEASEDTVNTPPLSLDYPVAALP